MSVPPVYRPNIPQGADRAAAAEFRAIGETTRRLKELGDTFSADITTLQGDVTALQAADTALDGRLDAIEALNAGTRLTALEGADVALDGRLDVIEALNPGTRLNALEAADTVLDGRLDAIEAINAGTRLGTLEAEASPPGLVGAFARNSAPSGWLKANGALVSRTTYAALFAAIGTTFGVGDGSTTFGLPDLRGEFIRGWDDGRGIDSGRVFGTAQADELKSHAHTTNILTALRTNGGVVNYETAVGSNSFGAVVINSTGGSETRARNIALLYCIKF